MADDMSWIGPLIASGAKYLNSNKTADDSNGVMQSAFADMLRNMQERFGDYDALGSAGYQDLAAQQLGPSALESIPEDLVARGAQQESMAALEELAANGGLSLADMQALNEIQNNLNRNTMARRKGLANEYAARGQLGSGAQMAMDLAGQQQAAESANQRGESVAAQAQARALQAILQKGQVARGMGQDDYSRRAEAARARDAIEARNAAARTDAGKYNNSIRGQAWNDKFRTAQGKAGLTTAQNEILYNRGTANRNTIQGKGEANNAAINQLSGIKFGGGGGSSGGSTQGNTTTTDTPSSGWYDEPAGPEYRPEELEE